MRAEDRGDVGAGQRLERRQALTNPPSEGLARLTRRAAERDFAEAVELGAIQHAWERLPRRKAGRDPAPCFHEVEEEQGEREQSK